MCCVKTTNGIHFYPQIRSSPSLPPCCNFNILTFPIAKFIGQPFEHYIIWTDKAEWKNEIEERKNIALAPVVFISKVDRLCSVWPPVNVGLSRPLSPPLRYWPLSRLPNTINPSFRLLVVAGQTILWIEHTDHTKGGTPVCWLRIQALTST